MAGFSGTPLIKKIGLANVSQAFILNPPIAYSKLLADWDGEYISSLQDNLNWIQAFFTDRDALHEEILMLKNSLALDGQLWISWPKQSSKIESNLDGNTVRIFGLDAGLVDVKIAAIDNDWSGIKFVYRLSDRK